jgi:hypothetical protein
MQIKRDDYEDKYESALYARREFLAAGLAM